MSVKWYVVEAYGHHGEWVKQAIEERVQARGLTSHILRILAPIEGKAREIKLLSPSRLNISDKLLLEMEMNEETCKLVLQTIGVKRFSTDADIHRYYVETGVDLKSLVPKDEGASRQVADKNEVN